MTCSSAAPLDYVHVDVFSERPFGGNSLPVFANAPPLETRQMLAITQELRHFESIFLERAPRAHRVRARIFDLFEELVFAGHPIIGAAVVLHNEDGGAGEQHWDFDLPAKSVTVVTRKTEHGFSGVLDQGAPQFLGEIADREAFAHAFGLAMSDLDDTLPLEVVSTGLRYIIVPVRPRSLQYARVRHDLTALVQKHGGQFALLLDNDAVELRHWNNDGVIEDVATGSAAGTVAAYRLRHGLSAPGQEYVLAQGRFAGRPSRILVRAEGTGDAITSVKVGGEVSLVGRGSLAVRPAKT